MRGAGLAASLAQILALALAAAGGCGGGGATPDGGSDAASDAGIADRVGDALGGCTPLRPSTEPVSFSTAGIARPPAPGGALEPGTYDLVSVTYYPTTNCTNSPPATSLTFTPTDSMSGAVDLVLGTETGTFATGVGIYTVAGTTLTTDLDCVNPPDVTGTAGAPVPRGFGATKTELLLYEDGVACGAHIDAYRKR